MSGSLLARRKQILASLLAAGIAAAVAAEPMIPAGVPFLSVQASDPLASEPGNEPGAFAISRAGSTNSALTFSFSLSGTAANGVNYVFIPTSVTLAAGQVSTNIAVTPISEPKAAGYKTVILTLPRTSFREGEAAPPFLVGSMNRALVYIAYNYTNVPPTVSLAAPSNGASFFSKPNIQIAATASDFNGWVTAVAFSANGVRIGAVTNYPFGADPLHPLLMRESHGLILPELPGKRTSRFQFVWTNVPPGNYALTAVATDNAGLQTTSAAVDITVTTNLPAPQVRIVNPVNGASFPDFAVINVFAAARETNGVVDTVEFFDNTNSLGTATNYLATEPLAGQSPSRTQWLPYFFAWTNAPVGNNILTAVATDNNGSKATSAPVNITVTTNVFHRRH